jgi:hypothetical protein
MGPPVGPPKTCERVRGRSRRSENALDSRDIWRLPGDEHAIFSRVLFGPAGDAHSRADGVTPPASALFDFPAKVAIAITVSLGLAHDFGGFALALARLLDPLLGFLMAIRAIPL